MCGLLSSILSQSYLTISPYKRLFCFLSLQVGQSGSFDALKILNSILAPSQKRSFPFIFVPMSVRYLMVSRAWRVPMTPGVTPTTGNISSGGATGKRQRRQGVSGDGKKEGKPSIPLLHPYT